MLTIAAIGSACAAPSPRPQPLAEQRSPAASPPRVAHLGRDDGDAAGLRAIAMDFAARNPGYALDWLAARAEVAAVDRPRILFVQRGTARATVHAAAHANAGDVAVGDLIVLARGARASFAPAIDLLAFSLPDEPPADVPTFVRPDWDPRITDTPGGCATETGAYRRILLTWRRSVGPYTYAGLNAHRVRITDSFTHYHPVDGGFDEFYLVQMVQPGARLLTSDRTAEIERPEAMTRERATTLFDTTPLAIGDLVYLPRGLAHRGLGGVLAQVITVPGFVPGKEIGLDHHLRAIAERLGLDGDGRGDGAVPFHREGSAGPVVR